MPAATGNPSSVSFCRKKEKEKTTFQRTSELKLKTNLLVVLLLLVNGGLGNAVQIPLTGLGDATATLLLILLEDTDLLESLEDLAVDTTGGVNVVGGARATVFRGAVDLSETTDTNGLAEVDVTGDSGGADVEPEQRKQRLETKPSSHGYKDISYQSAFWGGSSLEAEVLTVSTHPNQEKLAKYSMKATFLISLIIKQHSGHEPGMGSFP